MTTTAPQEDVTVIGARSTFGEQVVSKRLTAPSYRFGSSHRTDPVYLEGTLHRTLGSATPGVTYNTRSSFGSQANSRNSTAPAHAFGVRASMGMGKTNEPGPGDYATTEAIGRQILSNRSSSPQQKFGKGNRWSNFSKDFKEEFMTPAAKGCDPTSGWLGDAPKFSFSGRARRYDFGTGGLPGEKRDEGPGPGQYGVRSSLGPQYDARKGTEANFRFGRSTRDKANDTLYMGIEHERALLAKHSPGPNRYQMPGSIGPQHTSKKDNAPHFKFGSSDRFSEIKLKNENRKLPGTTPGPGTYTPC